MADTNNTSFDLLNLQGSIFEKGQREKVTLGLVGGMGGLTMANSFEFDVGQQFEIDDHTSLPERLEGADAPDHTGVLRTAGKNVMEIIHEKITLTYTAMGNKQQMTQPGYSIDGSEGGNPIPSEWQFQFNAKWEKIQRQMNYRLINQVYRKPGDITTSRQSRGFLAAMTSNHVYGTDNGLVGGVAADLSEQMIDDLFVKMIDSGSVVDGDSVIFLANTTQLMKLNAIYKNYNNQSIMPEDRFIGGIRVRTIWTTFGMAHFVLERDMPQDTLAYINFGVTGLRGLDIEGYGMPIFMEELAKTGSSRNAQIYGEIGLDHGPEWYHGKITGLSTAM